MSAPTVIIPVKQFDRAKRRLAALLGPEERTAVAIATLRTVGCAVKEAGLLSVALTPEPQRVSDLGVVTAVIGESPALDGLNAQLQGLIDSLAGDILVLHADLPLATGDALKAFLEQAGTSDVALTGSSDGGTKALLLGNGARLTLAYGPGSFAAHLSAARTAGLSTAVIDSPELALDLDTADDIRVLLATERGRETPAGRVLLGLAR